MHGMLPIKTVHFFKGAINFIFCVGVDNALYKLPPLKTHIKICLIGFIGLARPGAIQIRNHQQATTNYLYCKTSHQ